MDDRSQDDLAARLAEARRHDVELLKLKLEVAERLRKITDEGERN